MCHWAVSTWEDRDCPGGCGSKRHGDVEGELLILGEYSPDIHPPTDVCSPLHCLIPHILPLVSCSPLGKDHPKCVSWVLTDAFYDSRNACLWEIFKRSSVTLLSTSVTLHSLPAKTNMSIVGASLCSEFSSGPVELASIVWMNLNPHSLPLDLVLWACGNTHVSPLFLFVCGQRLFHNSMPERSIISAALHVSHPTENSPQSYSLSWGIKMNQIQNNKRNAPPQWELLSGFLIQLRGAQCERGVEGSLWEKGKTISQTGYVPLPHLLPRTFRRKHLPPYTHSDTQWVHSVCSSLRKWILSVRIQGFPGGEGSWQG